MPWAVAVLRGEGDPEQSGLCPTRFLLLWGASWKDVTDGGVKLGLGISTHFSGMCDSCSMCPLYRAMKCALIPSVMCAGNSIRDEDIKALAAVLPQCKSLTSLNLESMLWLLYWAESMQTPQLQSWCSPAGPCDPVQDNCKPPVPAEPCLTVALGPEVSVMPWAVAVLRGKGDPEQSGLCPTRFLLLWGASWKDVTDGGVKLGLGISTHFSGMCDSCSMCPLYRAMKCALIPSVMCAGNSIGDEGTKALAAVLPQCKSLTSLNLASMFWLLYWAESMQTAQLQSWWFPAGPCDPVQDNSNPLSLQSPASLLHWGLRCLSCPGQLLF